MQKFKVFLENFNCFLCHRSHKKHTNNTNSKPVAATVEEPSTPRRQSLVLQNGNIRPADTNDTTSEQLVEALVTMEDATSEVTFKTKPIQQITAQTVNVDRMTIVSNSVSHSQPSVDNKVQFCLYLQCTYQNVLDTFTYYHQAHFQNKKQYIQFVLIINPLNVF